MSSDEMLSRKYAVSEDLVTREVAGETLLVPLRTSAGTIDYVFSLNDVGTYIWGLLDGNRTVGDIATAVVGEFEVEAAQAEADLAALLGQLIEVEAVKEV